MKHLKKTAALALTILLTLSALTGCGGKDGADTPAEEPAAPAIESALDFYTDVWARFAEEDRFPCGGGDADHENAEGPGQYLLTEDGAENFKYLLHVTDELYDMLENDAATLQHMMNLNTFSSAVVRLKDAAQAAEFAEGYKTAIQGQRWMCGFPDRVVVLSVGDYVVMAYGMEDNINNLTAACSAVEPQTVVLVDEAAVAE